MTDSGSWAGCCGFGRQTERCVSVCVWVWVCVCVSESVNELYMAKSVWMPDHHVLLNLLDIPCQNDVTGVLRSSVSIP